MKKRVLCFGDSNTWGADGENDCRFDEKTRWTARLQEFLGGGYTVIEEGQCGRTSVWTDPVEYRMSGIDYLTPCMDTHHPFDLIIIMLGTNDSKPYYSADAFNIARGVMRLAETAQKSAFGNDDKPPKVLIVSPILINKSALLNNSPMRGLFNTESAENVRRLASELEPMASAAGCAFLNAADFAHAGPDGVHIDRPCHETLARAIADAVRTLID